MRTTTFEITPWYSQSILSDVGYLGLIDIISLEEHSKYNFFFQMRTSFTFPLSIVILLAIEEKKAKEQA